MKTFNVRLEEAWEIMQEQILAGGRVRFMPKGTSMLPMIRQGIDSVVLSAAPEVLKKYDLPLYRRDNGQFVIHRVVDIKKDGYVMCGDNQYVREYPVTQRQILAIVEGYYKGDKYIACTDSEYLKYAKKRVNNRRIYGVYIRIRRFGGKILRKLHLK